MKKCPYCAEDIQNEAIKCKHCGEWLNSHSNNSPEKQLNSEDGNMHDNRVLCPDESCTGIINSENTCSVCGRTVNEIKQGQKSKAPEYQTPGTVPKKLVKRFRIVGGIALMGILLLALLGYIIPNFEINATFAIILAIFGIVIIIFNVTFLIYIARLSSMLGKNPILWIGGCFLFNIFFCCIRLLQIALFSYWERDLKLKHITNRLSIDGETLTHSPRLNFSL